MTDGSDAAMSNSRFLETANMSEESSNTAVESQRSTVKVEHWESRCRGQALHLAPLCGSFAPHEVAGCMAQSFTCSLGVKAQNPLRAKTQNCHSSYP